LDIGLRYIATIFQQELSFPSPPLPQGSCNTGELAAFNVVQHDNVCTSIDGFVRFCFRPDLYVEKKAEATDSTGLLYSTCNGACANDLKETAKHERNASVRLTGRPYVIVFQHYHA
jgi:hypothetical protein